MATMHTLTVKEAAIKTATIEVKTTTLSNKQVTLSVFRQLKEENILDSKTGDLLGVPWGTVNYFWGKCEPTPFKPDHMHVVWQKGTELRRACVQPDPWEDEYSTRAKELVKDYYLVLSAEGWEPDLTPSTYSEAHFVHTRGTRTIGVTFRYEEARLWPTKGVSVSLRESEEKRRIRVTDAQAKMWEAWDTRWKERLTGRDFQRDILDPHFLAWDAYCETYQRAYKELAALPQLFIAT